METILNQVNKVIKDSHKKIILSVFSQGVKTHKGYDYNSAEKHSCKCSYCMALERYVNFKIRSQHNLRRMEDQFPGVLPESKKEFFKEHINFTKQELKKLREYKNSLKLI